MKKENNKEKTEKKYTITFISNAHLLVEIRIQAVYTWQRAPTSCNELIAGQILGAQLFTNWNYDAR